MHIQLRHISRFPGFSLALTLFAMVLSSGSALAADPEDKRPLDHEDYAAWNTLGSTNLSNDGKWLSYSVTPGDGESTLVIREIATDKLYSIARGSSARFTFDNKFAVFIVAPDPEVIKNLRKEKKPSSALPKSKLEILDLASGDFETVPNVSRFSLPSKAAGWIAFQKLTLDDDKAIAETKAKLNETFEITEQGIRRPEEKKEFRKPKAQPESKEKQAGKGKAKKGEKSAEKEKSKSAASKNEKEEKVEPKEDKSNGSVLVLRNLETSEERRFPNTTNYRFSENAQSLAFATSTADGEGDGVHVIDLKSGDVRHILSGIGDYGQVVFSKDGQQVAFLSDRDDYAADSPAWSLYLWKRGGREAKRVADADAEAIPEGWWLSSSSAPLFTEDGKRLIFRTRPRPDDDDESDEDADPVAKLDLWHWQDPFLQPQQLLRAAQERNRSYEALYDIRRKKVIQLASKAIPQVSIDPRNPSHQIVGMAPDKYQKQLSWDTQSFSDWYLVDLQSGDARLVAEKRRGFPSLSPAGKYITWWDGEKRTWFAQSTSENGKMIDLGRRIKHPLQNELHDQPSLPSSYGSAGWLDDDEAILLYDRWDIWCVDPTGETPPICLTHGKGRREQTEFRYVRLDSEQRTIDLDAPQLLSAEVHATKATGYFRLVPSEEDGPGELERLILLDERVSGLRKAKESDAVMFTRSTFERCPDLWTSTLAFKKTRRMSRVNPQQDDFLWGTAELVHWNASDDTPIDGLLYKPENFDPEQKYPMLVYFYERNSDNLHRYYAPAAGRSIINISFYVSRGYVVFVPDIPYTVGEPGPSAANAVLPGVESIVEQGFIDPERIGMQGHSWGGYQTAYLVTVTDMFACAESGAPVSNMTSAYGGIRWGSGMSRMFQYEKTQSRIGGTLWEAREKYIANSPVFFADKVNTPLLILHNDQDTAVPWYQGIELFVALRRLEKPAWMLNYNGDPHWVMSDENRMDFTKRMQQFFDHYLKGDPMPVWMADGIPAVDKGKEMGFEYVSPEELKQKEPEAEAAETNKEPAASAKKKRSRKKNAKKRNAAKKKSNPEPDSAST